MFILESYLSGAREFVLGRLRQLCGVVWLPLLLGLSHARRIVLGDLSPSDCPPPDHREEDLNRLLEISKKRFTECKYGKFYSNIVETAEPFTHQVAGHTTEVLVRYKDIVLKPMLKGHCFYNELKFYETVFAPSAYGAHFPQRFVPSYHGTVLLPSMSGAKHPFIAMDDQTKGFARPSIIDIKMGQQTYEPGAPMSKVERTRAKYPYQEEIGFRVTGLKVYDGRSESYFATDKSYGRSLSPDNVAIGLLPFFYDGYRFRTDVLNILVEKLELLMRWFKAQNKFHFFCSSLLVVYEGRSSPPQLRHATKSNGAHFLTRAKQQYAAETDQCRSPVGASPNYLTSPPRRSRWIAQQCDSPVSHGMDKCHVQRQTGCTSADDVQIRMIDFAHTLPASDGLPDAGYIHGLSSLLLSLREALHILMSVPEDEIMAIFGSILASAKTKGSAVKHRESRSCSHD